MKDVVLIDSDIIAYRVGFTTETLPVEIAEIRTDELIRRIVHETEAQDYKCFLSGTENFRYDIYPAYKGQRAGKPKPVHLEAIREHIVRYHTGRVSNGVEADDELAIELTARGEGAILASVDKDLLQVPGWHYNFVKEKTSYITPLGGLRNLYGQIIAGDGADNVPSYDGKIRNEVPQFIARLQAPLFEMDNEWDMWNHCLDIFLEQASNEVEEISQRLAAQRNAHCLYLLRKENEHWQPPNDPNGQMPDLEHS